MYSNLTQDAYPVDIAADIVVVDSTAVGDSPAPISQNLVSIADTVPLSPNIVNIANTEVYVYVTFKDKKTGADLAVNGELIDLANGKVISTIKDSVDAQIHSVDVPAAQLGVAFHKFGYKTIKSTVDQLQLLPDPKTIYFEKGVGTEILFTAAGLAALLAFYYSRKNKKVGAFDAKKGEGIILVIALGVSAFLAYKLVKKILDFLGVTKSEASQGLDNASTNPNAFWNPNFWQTIKPANAAYSYAISYDTAAEWAKTLYDSFGIFNDNEEQAIGVFKQCRTQANASYLCYVFQHLYGEDCLSFLRGGWWPQDRLSDADVYTINNYVNALPKY